MSMSDFLASSAPTSASPPACDFATIGVSMTFAAGEEIYAQDEETDMVYQIQAGAVRATRLTSDGRRQIAGFYYPGDLFGLETGRVHRSSAEALGKAKVLVIKRSCLKHHGQAGERLERLIWRATGAELERAHEHMMLLVRKSAVEKVAGFLSGLLGRRRAVDCELPMSRQDIADHLGLSIETVSRMISQLQGDGLIALDGCRRFRVLAPQRLARLAVV